nr:LysR substrate-binding domain-containing protein [Caballeronia hypogeia]
MRHLARNLSAHPGGLLRVGCIPSLGLGLVPRVIASFMKQCPDVSINIRTENNETLAALLLAQEIDVAVAFEPPVTPGITIEELGRARAVLFDSRTHDIEETMVQLSDLDFPNWIALDPEDPLGARVSAAVAVMGRELTPMIEVKTYYLARALVESGVGFTIIDEYTAYSHAGDHRNVVPVEPEVSVGVCLMTSASNASSQALRVLVEQLTRELAKHGTRSTPG